MLSYYKSQLKSAAKSGPQYVTITEVKDFADDKGESLSANGHFGTVVTFKNDNIEHQEMYWLFGSRGNLYLRIVKKLTDESGSHLIGKKLWIVIRHNILINDKQQEVKRESEIVHYSVGDKAPNYPAIFEQYDIAANVN
jgi:hypothetical protein